MPPKRPASAKLRLLPARGVNPARAINRGGGNIPAAISLCGAAFGLYNGVKAKGVPDVGAEFKEAHQHGGYLCA